MCVFMKVCVCVCVHCLSAGVDAHAKCVHVCMGMRECVCVRVRTRTRVCVCFAIFMKRLRPLGFTLASSCTNSGVFLIQISTKLLQTLGRARLAWKD